MLDKLYKLYWDDLTSDFNSGEVHYVYQSTCCLLDGLEALPLGRLFNIWAITDLLFVQGIKNSKYLSMNGNVYCIFYCNSLCSFVI